MSPPSYTLYTPAGSFRAFAPLITAECNHIEITVETENVEQVAQEKSPTGKLPLLERNNSNGEVIGFASSAIARYIAGLRTDTCLTGGSWQEKTMIDQWIDWCGAELELPACLLFYPLAGYMKVDPETAAKAKADFFKALQVLQDQLSKSSNDITYLVGDRLTLADIIIVSTLVYPLQMALDRETLTSFGRVVTWFEHCTQQRLEFEAVLGKIIIGSKMAPVSVEAEKGEQ